MRNEQTLVPELRFPGFNDEWKLVPLGDDASEIKERAGTTKYPVMSVETGVGLVSQLEKFGRDISGKSYKNYTVIEKDDFAYNKSATKEFPEGFIAKHNADFKAAVPNSIFTCFRLNSGAIDCEYLYFQLLGNLHGRWLRKFITVGARAHGALSVNTDDLLALPVPLPMGESSIAEQQKIADCLGSLDELIAAHSRKLTALQDHKKGLLQQLFPAEGETTPKLRFPGFENAGGWTAASIGKKCSSFSGGTPSSSNKDYYGGNIPFIRSAEIAQKQTALFLTEEGFSKSAAKMVKKGDVLVALYGANSGDVSISKINGAINQAILCLRSKESNSFIYHYLTLRKEWILRTYLQGGQGNLSGEIMKSVELRFPKPEEQSRIAMCLNNLDALITAQTEQIAALKEHKKGLMQQLFPGGEQK